MFSLIFFQIVILGFTSYFLSAIFTDLDFFLSGNERNSQSHSKVLLVCNRTFFTAIHDFIRCPTFLHSREQYILSLCLGSKKSFSATCAFFKKRRVDYFVFRRQTFAFTRTVFSICAIESLNCCRNVGKPWVHVLMGLCNCRFCANIQWCNIFEFPISCV